MEYDLVSGSVVLRLLGDLVAEQRRGAPPAGVARPHPAAVCGSPKRLTGLTRLPGGLVCLGPSNLQKYRRLSDRHEVRKVTLHLVGHPDRWTTANQGPNPYERRCQHSTANKPGGEAAPIRCGEGHPRRAAGEPRGASSSVPCAAVGPGAVHSSAVADGPFSKGDCLAATRGGAAPASGRARESRRGHG